MSSCYFPQKSRRAFLKAAACSMALGACNSQNFLTWKEHLTPQQRSWHPHRKSHVGIIPCQSYEENIFSYIKPFLPALSLPSLSGKTVVVKPNIVEFHPTKPIHTDPKMILTAVELADYLGAREIIVAEGPGHFRDTEYLLAATGIGATCKKLGLRFVDLNLDSIEKIDNPDGFTRQKHFFLPNTVVTADALISLPKLKTHHWVGMTASMKNMFGTIPGRKYGWPKNLLHWLGINSSIIDLVHLVRPTFALVDAVVSMEGDGPVNGFAKQSGFVVIGDDLSAVDATCARTMKLDPFELDYIKMAGEVIGNIEPKDITILGSSIESVAQRFKMPITYQNKELMKECQTQAS